MLATGLESTAGRGTQLSTLPSKALGKDDFLNLLITQLQNQDPGISTGSIRGTDPREPWIPAFSVLFD